MHFDPALLRLMSAKGIHRLAKSLLLVITALLAACSNSDSLDNINDPDLIVAAQFAFISNNQIYEYIPERKTTIKLIDLSDTVYSPVDADPSGVEESFEQEAVTFRDAYPEFIVYAKEQELLAFEFDTRETHTLYDFSSNTGTNEYICDIRTPILPDIEASKRNQFLVANEFAVSVKTSLDAACSGGSEFEYYYMPFEETGETYLIRKVDSTDGSVDTLEEPYYRVRRQSSSEAQMYSRAIITDFDSQKYARFGIDSTSSELVFFTAPTSEPSPAKTELWRLYGAGFGIEAESFIQRSTPSSLSLSKNQPVSARGLDDELLIENGWAISSISKTNLFEDDATTERSSAIDNPLINRTIPPSGTFVPTSFIYYETGNSQYFIDNLSIVELTLGTSGSVSVLPLDSAAQSYTMSLAAGTPSLLKQISASSSSLVSLDNNIESTLVAQTNASLMLMYQQAPEATLVNEFDDSGFRAIAFATPEKEVSLQDAFFVNALDERFYAGHENGTTFMPVIVRKTSELGGSERFIISTLLSEGTGLTLPEENLAWTSESVIPHEDNEIRLVNDHFGLVKLMTETADGPVLNYYYFNPIDKFLERPTPFDPLPELELITLPST